MSKRKDPSPPDVGMTQYEYEYGDLPKDPGPTEIGLTKYDNVSRPKHYTSYKGLEVIDLTEQLNFNRGNAVKYTARAGLKNPAQEVEDLRKAIWYLEREIQRITS